MCTSNSSLKNRSSRPTEEAADAPSRPFFQGLLRSGALYLILGLCFVAFWLTRWVESIGGPDLPFRCRFTPSLASPLSPPT
jgi:hypothetical protein